MAQEETGCKLIAQDKDGKIVQTQITQEERDRIFFNEGNRMWDTIQMFLPKPQWEKIYDGGHLYYEGETIDHKAFGIGRVYFKDGSLALEGIFGIKGLLCGRTYYSNGVVQFDGLFRLNQAYGPNFPEYGAWYDRDGKLKYRGKFQVSRSSLGFPHVYKPEGFGSVPYTTLRNGHTFIWEDARKYMPRELRKKQDNEAAATVRQVLRRAEQDAGGGKAKAEMKPEDGFSVKYIQALLERKTPGSLTEEHAKLLEGKTPAEAREIRDRLALEIMAEYPYKTQVEMDYLDDLRRKRIDERNWLEHLDEMTGGEITFMLEQQPGKDGLDKNRQAHPEITDRIRAEFMRDFGC